MTNVHSREIRTKNMRAIRSKNTTPEMVVRRTLHRAGFRYGLHGVGLPGKPDLVLTKYRTAIFVNGCFWHGHLCHLFRWPKTRPEFWKSKIQATQIRDSENIKQLFQGGWSVIVIWECTLRSGEAGLAQMTKEIKKFLARRIRTSAQEIMQI